MKILKWLFAVGFVLLAASVFIRTYSQARKDPDTDEDQEEAVQVPSRVSVVNGQTVVTLDAATQKRLGIAVSPLTVINARRQETASATVLSAQGLAPLHNAYVSAEAQVEIAQAQLAVSSQEYERLKTLYAENQNTSEKSLQAAQGTLRTNRARLDAARKSLEIASSAVQQSWGGAVAGWVVNDSPRLASVLSQRACLVQLTLPPGTSFEEPPEINLSTSNGNSVKASYVSPFPQVDPRIQGISLLYLAHSYPALEPGMNLVARLPVGKWLRGILIPHSAIVWWQGQAWVYEQTAPTRFTRRTVPAEQPLGDGYFAAQGFAAGAKVVTQGAQVLLSEEFRSQIQPED
ncbi:MAG TPA: multidrug transporter [Terriglobia bacterium]|nr:multidrug transporter [Terriglobia bacterium]